MAEDERTDLAQIAAQYKSVDWARAFANQPTETRWLVEPIIEEGTVCAIFGVPDSHKSLFVLELSLRLARDWRTVVYIDQENRLTDLVNRLGAFGATPEELGCLHLYSYPELPALDTPRGGRHLKAIAVTHDADLVILDTTARMVEGSENDADTYHRLYRSSLLPLKGHGITSLRIDHPGKDPAKGQRGSSAKDGDADVIWWMQKMSGTKFRLSKRRDRTGNAPEYVELELRHNPLRHEWARTGSRTGDLVKLLDDAGVAADASRTDTREALTKLGASAANSLLSEVMAARRFRSGSPADRRGPPDRESREAGPPMSASIEADRPPDQDRTSDHERALRVVQAALNGEVIKEETA
jgi:hypothetical protein